MNASAVELAVAVIIGCIIGPPLGLLMVHLLSKFRLTRRVVTAKPIKPVFTPEECQVRELSTSSALAKTKASRVAAQATLKKLGVEIPPETNHRPAHA